MIAELMGLLQEDDIDLVILNEAPPLLKGRSLHEEPLGGGEVRC